MTHVRTLSESKQFRDHRLRKLHVSNDQRRISQPKVQIGFLMLLICSMATLVQLEQSKVSRPFFWVEKKVAETKPHVLILSAFRCIYAQIPWHSISMGLVLEHLPDEQYIEPCTAKIAKLTMKTARKVLRTEATKPLSVVALDLLCTCRSIRSIHRSIEVKMADSIRKDWRELCVAVTNESDSSKLSSLVQELIEALDRGERSWRHIPCAPEAMATNQGAA